MTEEFIAIEKFIALSCDAPMTPYHWKNPWNQSRPALFVPSFILAIEWDCDTEHMVEKYMECVGYDCGWLIPFYCKLDSENRYALIDYLTNTYNETMSGEVNIKAMCGEY